MDVRELREQLETVTQRLVDLHGEIERAYESDEVDEERVTHLEQEFERCQRDAEQLRRRIERAEAAERARKEAEAVQVAAASADAGERARVEVGQEEPVYRPDGEHSFFRDLAAAREGDIEAAERLRRHRTQTGTEQRAISTTDGSGGDLVPPTYLISDYAEFARAGRPLADAIGSLELPAGTDSVMVPRITGGTTAAIQTTQNTAVSNTDMQSATVSSPVVTIAGQQVVSRQLLEQSPVQVDRIVLEDLARAIAQQVDAQVIAGTGSGGQLRGLLAVSGGVAVTYTDTTPTVQELYSAVANAIQQIHTTRFAAPTLIAMHPRRWAWILAASDAQGRPLVTPYAGQNLPAQLERVAPQAIVGQMHGLPVLVDPNIPTNLGAGTNEDRILVLRLEDLRLWESAPRFMVGEQPLMQQLSVAFVGYEYAAFIPDRQPKSVGVIAGTGLVAPTF